MKCNKYSKIFEYVQGELDSDESALTEKHFSSCPDCSGILDFMRSLKEIKPLTAPESILAEIMEKTEDSQFSSSAGLKTSFLSFLLHPVTVPIVLIFVIVGVLVFLSPSHSGLTKVAFAIDFENAKSVSLAGDFNNWDPSRGNLERRGKMWTGSFLVQPGRYQYMLIIDGNQWIPDPNAKEYVNDGYGNKNSLIDTTKI